MDKILMVEDDATLRDWFEAMLKGMGRDIDWVTKIEQARDLLNDPAQHYGLVVSDFNLHSKSTGLDLWQFCQKRMPDMPFLLISGAPDSLFHDMVRSGAPCPEFLLKPFGAREFKDVLQSMLTLKHGKISLAG